MAASLAAATATRYHATIRAASPARAARFLWRRSGRTRGFCSRSTTVAGRASEARSCRYRRSASSWYSGVLPSSLTINHSLLSCCPTVFIGIPSLSASATWPDHTPRAVGRRRPASRNYREVGHRAPRARRPRQPGGAGRRPGRPTCADDPGRVAGRGDGRGHRRGSPLAEPAEEPAARRGDPGVGGRDDRTAGPLRGPVGRRGLGGTDQTRGGTAAHFGDAAQGAAWRRGEVAKLLAEVRDSGTLGKIVDVTDSRGGHGEIIVE